MLNRSLKLILFVSVLTATILVFGQAPLIAKDKPIKLIYGTFDPPSGVLAQSATYWGEELEARSKGKIKVEYLWSQKPGELFDMTKSGIIDVGYTVPGFNTGMFPYSEIVGLPYVIPTAVIGSKGINAYYKKGFTDKASAEVKVLFSGAMAADSIYTKDKAITKLADIKGLKIHAGTTEISNRIKLMGGVPVFIPYPELYGSLQKGIIDGMVMGYAVMEIFRLFEVTKYAMAPPMGTGVFSVVMNERTWNKIPPELQKIIDDVSGEFYIQYAQAWDKACERGKELFLDAGGQINTLDKTELQKVNEAIHPIWGQWVKQVKKKRLKGQEAVDAMYDILKGLGVEDPAIGYSLKN